MDSSPYSTPYLTQPSLSMQSGPVGGVVAPRRADRLAKLASRPLCHCYGEAPYDLLAEAEDGDALAERGVSAGHALIDAPCAIIQVKEHLRVDIQLAQPPPEEICVLATKDDHRKRVESLRRLCRLHIHGYDYGVINPTMAGRLARYV